MAESNHDAGGSDIPGVPLPPPFIYLAGLALGGVAELVRSTNGPPWPISLTIALAGVLVFAALAGAAMRRFRRAGTTENPFKPSTALVTDGPNRLTRNPIYLGMASLYVGLAFLLGWMWALLLLPVVLVAVDRLIIAREEPYLERKFGQDYVDYKRRVRRWI
jgi:protein-S-isoprenylcysteine O-methyltransferase Ste14